MISATIFPLVQPGIRVTAALGQCRERPEPTALGAQILRLMGDLPAAGPRAPSKLAAQN